LFFAIVMVVVVLVLGIWPKGFKGVDYGRKLPAERATPEIVVRGGPPAGLNRVRQDRP
jgi:hypothetical protein